MHETAKIKQLLHNQISLFYFFATFVLQYKNHEEEGQDVLGVII